MVQSACQYGEKNLAYGDIHTYIMTRMDCEKNIISGEIHTYIMTRMEFPIGDVFFAFLNLLDHTEDAIVKDLHVNMLKHIDLAELQISVSIIKWHFLVILLILGSKLSHFALETWLKIHEIIKLELIN